MARTPVGSGRDVGVRARRAIRTCSPGHHDAAGTCRSIGSRRLRASTDDEHRPWTARNPRPGAPRLPRMRPSAGSPAPSPSSSSLTGVRGAAAPSRQRRTERRPRLHGAVAQRGSARARRPERTRSARTSRPAAASARQRRPLTSPSRASSTSTRSRWTLLTADVDGRHVQVVTATWTSGVEPCYVLDRIVVERATRSFTITLREGHGPGERICIEIAKTKQPRSTWASSSPARTRSPTAQGGAAPIECRQLAAAGRPGGPDAAPPRAATCATIGR